MRNLKLQIEYDGTHYCGWQIQSHKSHSCECRQVTSHKSIQETIEQVLQKILQEKVKLIVSGRTDAGVHAVAQVANFKTKNPMPLIRLQWALNGLLPKDIIITKIKTVGLDFNSRFSAKSKIYRYTVLNRAYSSPLLRNRVYFYRYPLNIPLMRKEAKALLGKHNFSSFQAVDSSYKPNKTSEVGRRASSEVAFTGKPQRNPIKTIKKLIIKKINYSLSAKRYPLLIIDIEADGFLYNMVRNIVGTLLEIGRGKIEEGSMKKILSAKNRISAGSTAPASGLCLMKVKY